MVSNRRYPYTYCLIQGVDSWIFVIFTYFCYFPTLLLPEVGSAHKDADKQDLRASCLRKLLEAGAAKVVTLKGLSFRA